MSQDVVFVINDTTNFHLHRRPMADALSESGWSVGIIGPSGEGGRSIADAGYKYYSIPLVRKSTNPISENGTIRSLSRLYRRISPSLVHHFTVKPVVYGGIAARRAGVPAVVSTITGLGYVFSSSSLKAHLLRPIVRAGYKKAFKHPNHVVVYQNHDDGILMEEMGVSNGNEPVIIPGAGIDVSKYPVGPDPRNNIPVVALAARMLIDKGIEEFVEASKILRARKIPVRFVLIGDTDSGNPAAISPERLTTWKNQGLVELWGWRDDVIDLLTDIDVACLPSHREGFPRFLLEAATRGRPIVATDVPGCRAVVRHEENGILVPPRNSFALAEAIESLLRDPKARARMGSAGRRRVEAEFDVKHIVAATLKVYEDVLSRRPTK